MEKNCFELLIDKMREEMGNLEIKKIDTENFEINSKNCIYTLNYDKNSKLVNLKKAEKIASSWMLNEKMSSSKDIKMIAEDFKNTILNPPKKISKIIKKSSNDESNVTGLFLANRIANIFPQIKEKIQSEKETYGGNFRAVKFTSEYILPLINESLNSNDIQIVKKLGKLLSDMYANGTLDAKSIITMGILNNIKNKEFLFKNISEQLQLAWKHAEKYKGKYVRPEKEKKHSSFMSKALEYQKELDKQ